MAAALLLMSGSAVPYTRHLRPSGRGCSLTHIRERLLTDSPLGCLSIAVQVLCCPETELFPDMLMCCTL